MIILLSLRLTVYPIIISYCSNIGTAMLNQCLNQSSEHLRCQNFDEAFNLMQTLSIKNPYTIESILNKSTLCMKKGNIQQGLSYLKNAREVDPFDFRIYYNMFAIYWRSRQYFAALQSFKKCLSVLHILKVVNRNSSDLHNNYVEQLKDIDRALELWDQNTAAYAMKSIYLINSNKIEQANQVTKKALQKCIMKHHIFALCCLIDTKLTLQAQRQQNAKDYHSHLLRPLVINDQEFPSNDSASPSTGKVSEQITHQLNKLIEQFNQLNKLSELSIGKYRRYNSVPDVYFVSVKKKTSINIQYQISKNLGSINLGCISEQNQNNDANNEDVDQSEDDKIGKKKKKSKKMVTYKQELVEQRDLQKNADEPKQKELGQQKPQTQIASQDIRNQKIVLDNQNQQLLLQNSTSVDKPKYQTESTIPKEISDYKNQSKQTQEQHQQNVPQVQQKQNGFFKLWKETQIQKKLREIRQNQQSKQQQHNQSLGNSKQQKNKNNSESELLYPITHANFQVKLILADLQINQQLFGKMDPYVYYQYGNQKHKSTIAKGQGTKPRWQNEIKVFSLQKVPTIMKVSVYDRQVFKWDDLVGIGSFQVTKTGMHIIPIYLNHALQKKSGEVMFVISKVK